ncbi:MAG TPA: outer membrane lipoprotein-sorting protein [Terriglobales bacterium]|nr:outer membrane lipoprotein-sorting protein [Terriglobales bacterium]
MRVLSPTRAALILSCFCLSLPTCWAQSSNLTLDQILNRMQQSETESRQQSVAYRVTREYQLAPAGAQQPSSEVVAEINFLPPSAKDYSIVKSEGNDRGAGIVRKVLDHEKEMAGRSEQVEITPRNYDFKLLGRDVLDGHDCYRLELSPKRNAMELVKGQAWVDADSFAIRKIEGTTAKSPSFWIKDLKVTINYGQVEGVWLQTSTQATADVRFAGPHVLTSRELDVRRATFDAQNHPPRRVRQRRNPRQVGADTATWVAR